MSSPTRKDNRDGARHPLDPCIPLSSRSKRQTAAQIPITRSSRIDFSFRCFWNEWTPLVNWAGPNLRGIYQNNFLAFVVVVPLVRLLGCYGGRDTGFREHIGQKQTLEPLSRAGSQFAAPRRPASELVVLPTAGDGPGATARPARASQHRRHRGRSKGNSGRRRPSKTYRRKSVPQPGHTHRRGRPILDAERGRRTLRTHDQRSGLRITNNLGYRPTGRNLRRTSDYSPSRDGGH